MHGAMPDWYVMIRVARWLGVSPWELNQQNEVWLDWAIDAMNAEALAEKKPKKP